MARKKSLQPSYRLHKPSGLAVVTLDGRTLYLGKHGTEESRRRYFEVLAEWLAKPAAAPVIPPVTGQTDDLAYTVDDLINRFLSNYAGLEYTKNGKPTSEQGAMKAAFRPLHLLYGSTAAKDFGPLELKAVRTAMHEQHAWCRGSINKHVMRIRFLFRWAAAEAMIPAAVVTALDMVKGITRKQAARLGIRETERIKPVSPAHVEAIRPYVAPQIMAMVDLQLLTGMRPGEVVQMRAVDIDMGGDIWVYRPASHKTEHHDIDREICLGPRARGIVKDYLSTDTEAYLFRPADAVKARSAKRKTHRRPGQRPTRRRTERRLRDRYDVNSYRRAITRGCDRAFPCPDGEDRKTWRKLHRWHPHRLRHTAATLIRKQFGVEAAQAILGHQTLDVTQIYAETNREAAVQVMASIG